jgi:hypothetical protein
VCAHRSSEDVSSVNATFLKLLLATSFANPAPNMMPVEWFILLDLGKARNSVIVMHRTTGVGQTGNSSTLMNLATSQRICSMKIRPLTPELPAMLLNESRDPQTIDFI